MTTLKAAFPELIKYWDPSNSLSFKQATPGSSKVVKWRCPNNHTFEKSIVNQVQCTQRNNPCLLCTSSQNSLATKAPLLAQQWHPTKNRKLSPYDVSHRTAKKVWWKCQLGHSWSASIYHRSKFNTGCPECCSSRFSSGTSKIERDLAAALQEIFDFDIDQHIIRTRRSSYNCDIVIEKANLIIEFDGEYWHKDRIQRDRYKSASLRKAGYTVIRLRENKLPLLHPHDLAVPSRATSNQLLDLLLDHIDYLGI